MSPEIDQEIRDLGFIKHEGQDIYDSPWTTYRYQYTNPVTNALQYIYLRSDSATVDNRLEILATDSLGGHFQYPASPWTEIRFKIEKLTEEFKPGINIYSLA